MVDALAKDASMRAYREANSLSSRATAREVAALHTLAAEAMRACREWSKADAHAIDAKMALARAELDEASK